MAERYASDTNMAGAHTPDSPSSREERYTAKTARANMDIPNSGRFDWAI